MAEGELNWCENQENEMSSLPISPTVFRRLQQNVPLKVVNWPRLVDQC